MKLIRMINKQMEKIGFDPVSGNEVPLGGTPEGVRDDIDAKLSKGEMVIPEYAVNYHGVETYIDSIQKAQEGYKQLEDMGLVGNPDEAIMDESEPLPKMEDKDIPEYQIGGLTTTPLSSVSLPSIPAISPANVTQPLAPVSTQVTPTMQTVGSFDASTLQVGGYKIIPYVNDVGNTVYVASINGQIVGNVPTGYSPAIDSQTISQQTASVQQPPIQQPIQQPVKVEPKVTISPAGSTPPSTAVPSATTSSATTPSTAKSALSKADQQSLQSTFSQTAIPSITSTGKSSLSAENQATIQSIHSQPNLSAKDIVAQTAPDAKSFLSKPVADLGPLGKIDVGDISKVGISLASSFLGLPSGASTVISGALSSLAFSGNQPATAMMQGAINPNTGKPSIAGTGYHPASGWSFHATQTPFGLATVAFNENDVTAIASPMAIKRGIMAVDFNKDLTNMTDAEINQAQLNGANGEIVDFPTAPDAINTIHGQFLSDGSFQNRYDGQISAMGYASDVISMSALDQATLAHTRSQQPFGSIFGIHKSFLKDEAFSLISEIENVQDKLSKDPNMKGRSKSDLANLARLSVRSTHRFSNLAISPNVNIAAGRAAGGGKNVGYGEAAGYGGTGAAAGGGANVGYGGAAGYGGTGGTGAAGGGANVGYGGAGG